MEMDLTAYVSAEQPLKISVIVSKDLAIYDYIAV